MQIISAAEIINQIFSFALIDSQKFDFCVKETLNILMAIIHS
jgi:hypothetical protein